MRSADVPLYQNIFVGNLRPPTDMSWAPRPDAWSASIDRRFLPTTISPGRMCQCVGRITPFKLPVRAAAVSFSRCRPVQGGDFWGFRDSLGALIDKARIPRPDLLT